jgi:hypothetical protein
VTTQTMPKPTTRPAHNFNPVVHHYYRGRDIGRSQATREPITALCGDVGPVSVSATSQLSNGALVVCPLCSMSYDNRRARP